MTIDPKDLRTLLVRVTLVTLAVRAVPLLSSDLVPGEAAAAMGLGPEGLSAEPLAQLWRAWLHASGGMGLAARLPALVADLLLPALAVVFARAAGWGAIAGLMAALVFAIAPIGIEAGFRIDAGALPAALALAALVLLQRGLTNNEVRRIALSAVVLCASGILAPTLLLVAPVGLCLAALALGARRTKTAALVSWGLAALLAAGGRAWLLGHFLPEATRAEHWLAASHLSGDGGAWLRVAALPAALQALATMGPAGAQGELAAQLQMPAAPLWSLVLTLALAGVAAAGLALGRVQADPSAPTQIPASEAGGAAAADGWRTLGVGGALTVPRALGLRDWLPLLLGVILAAADVGVAAQRGDPSSLFARLAVGRVCFALLLGVGITAWAMPSSGGSPSELVRRKRRFNFTMAAAAAAVFGLGALHLMQWTRSVDPLAPRRVAQFARDQMAQDGALLALGPRGLSVAFLLDPLANQQRVRVASLDPAEAKAHLAMLLRRGPEVLVMAGDRDALGETGTQQAQHLALLRLAASLRGMLEASHYQAVPDGHAFLGQTAVAAFTRATQDAADPSVVRPQLVPGVAP